MLAVGTILRLYYFTFLFSKENFIVTFVNRKYSKCVDNNCIFLTNVIDKNNLFDNVIDFVVLIKSIDAHKG